MRETSKALAAFEAYYALGPDRSLRKLADGSKRRAKAGRKFDLATLEKWSSAFGWQARVAERDRAQAEANAEAQRARIASIMATGYAQAHERVVVLNELVTRLLADLSKKDLWLLVDRKLIGDGDDSKVFDKKDFNSAEIAALRGLLDDLAKETGGRKHISESSTLSETYEQRIRRQREERGLPPEPDSDVAE